LQNRWKFHDERGKKPSYRIKRKELKNISKYYLKKGLLFAKNDIEVAVLMQKL